MMLTMKPVPVTVLNVPIPREEILEAIVVVRTKTGVEVAGALSEPDRCKDLLLDGLTRLHEMAMPAGVEDRERGEECE